MKKYVALAVLAAVTTAACVIKISKDTQERYKPFRDGSGEMVMYLEELPNTVFVDNKQ